MSAEKKINLNNAEFITSAANAGGFIHNDLPQIVFAGRSNVGKSSVINRILNRKNFARVAGTPGKTVHINYFLIDKTWYFVDIPGYGYAKVSQSEKQRWATLIESYFADPDLLSVGVMIVDARHKPSADDCVMGRWFKDTGAHLIVVANKLDKLKKSEIEPNLERIRLTLELDSDVPVIPFSAEKGTGKEELIGVMTRMAEDARAQKAARRAQAKAETEAAAQAMKE